MSLKNKRVALLDAVVIKTSYLAPFIVAKTFICPMNEGISAQFFKF